MDDNCRNISLLEIPALADLVAATPIVEHTIGEALFQTGELCVSLPVIESGTVTIYAIGIAGRQVALYRLKAGAVCPISLSALLQRSTYSATAIADTSIQVRYLPGEKLKATISSTAEIFRIFLDTFADCLCDSVSTAHQQFVRNPDQPGSVAHENIVDESGNTVSRPANCNHLEETDR